MWILKKRVDETLFLTWDGSKWHMGPKLRGIWEHIGQKGVIATERAVAVNEAMGYICCEDDEGNVRVLVCKD